METLTEFFKAKTVATLLDVGTGPGHFIKVLKEALPSTKITGIDPDHDSLEEARATYPEVTFREMKGEFLDFPDNSFDAASISMVLHHLSDVQLTLKEMQRVVKSGGWIIVNELFSDNLNPAQEVHKRIHHFRSKIDRMNGICHNESFKKEEIIHEVKKSGLEVVLQFENRKTANPPTPEEIQERKEKLHAALKQLEGRPEYHEMAAEVPRIEADLEKFGFEMATRLIVVGRVK
ncbi:class I SAM-dependent methyltransferase [Maribellus sediminis]|uniref:class I SAM-dependent methyltransferase n=1 Tax=Maribellus sediminis TaxID=2696285 RepID=UPI001430E810|nr:class I SAM-dependent methyltransferase [Maribellus sediminis]